MASTSSSRNACQAASCSSGEARAAAARTERSHSSKLGSWHDALMVVSSPYQNRQLIERGTIWPLWAPLRPLTALRECYAIEVVSDRGAFWPEAAILLLSAL
jgi:hypothetical protein